MRTTSLERGLDKRRKKKSNLLLLSKIKSKLLNVEKKKTPGILLNYSLC